MSKTTQQAIGGRAHLVNISHWWPYTASYYRSLVPVQVENHQTDNYYK